MNVNPLNNAHLKVGEKLICVQDVEFSNGEKHFLGQTFIVEPETQAYFSLFTRYKGGATIYTYYIKIPS